MGAILLFSLIVGLNVLCAMGQATNGLSAHHEKAVEENLRYATVIKGRPDPGMSLLEQMSKTACTRCEHRGSSWYEG